MKTGGILKITTPVDGSLVYSQADYHRSQENHITFQHVMPKRKIDTFGRDATNASDYFLSAAVYPTGVRAPPLADLQQRCGPMCRIEDENNYASQFVPYTNGAGPAPKILTLRKHKNDCDTSTEQTSSERIHSMDLLTRMKPYHWDDVNGLGKLKNDVRDPCYIYKYCADERPLRYNKNSNLPRISSSPRPWSVGESDPSKRMFSSCSTDKRTDTPSVIRRAATDHTGFQHTRKCRPFKPLSFQPISENDLKKPLLEVKHLSTRDQRNKLKGKSGCLFSHVKQCIRLLRNHDARRSMTIDRPLKAEVGRYRPFSTTMIRTPSITPTVIAHFRDHNSAETYKQYVAIQTLKAKLPGKSAGTQASGMFARNNTAASMYYDVDAHLVQSVIDSNIPAESKKQDTPRKKSNNSIDSKTWNELRNLDLDIVGTPITSARPRLTDVEIERDMENTNLCNRVAEGSLKSSDQLDVPIGPYLDEEAEPEVLVASIPLDELGNPVIWDQSDEEQDDIKESPMNVIKIPAESVASMRSVEDEDNVIEDDPNVHKEEKGC